MEKLLYRYDPTTFVYIDTIKATKDPECKDRWLIPPFTTDINPGKCRTGFVKKYSPSTHVWVDVRNYKGRLIQHRQTKQIIRLTDYTIPNDYKLINERAAKYQLLRSFLNSKFKYRVNTKTFYFNTDIESITYYNIAKFSMKKNIIKMAGYTTFGAPAIVEMTENQYNLFIKKLYANYLTHHLTKSVSEET